MSTMEFIERGPGLYAAGPVGDHEFRAVIFERNDGRWRLETTTCGFPLDQTTWERLQDAQGRAEVELRVITTVTPGAMRDPAPRIIAGGRDQGETCEAHTTGCRIDHDAEEQRDGSLSIGCEVW